MRNTLFPMAFAGFLLLAISMVATLSEAFLPPLSDVRPTRMATPDSTRLFMFDWINDAFGNKSKQEEQAAAKAKAEAEAQQKAEAEAAAAAAAAQKKQEEKALAEEQQRQRAEEDAAMIAKAKEEAEAKFAQFEAEQKAKAEAEEAERAAAKRQAEEKAAAEAAAAEKAAAEAAAAEKAAAEADAAAKAALEQAEADAVAAKVIAEAEAASKQTPQTETAPPPPAEGDSFDRDSIDQLIQEAVKTKSRVKGVVQWYNGGSGFGFIKPFQTPEEEGKLVRALRKDRLEKSMDQKSTTYSAGVFVHHSKIRAPDNTFFRKLYAVETVEMEIGFDGKGRPIATDVTGPGGDYVKAILKQESDRVHQAK